jgi:FixJ family two-component response regulator
MLQSETKKGPARPTVLIVDDDPAVLGSLKFSLEIEGYSVDVFTGPDEFLVAAPPSEACLLIDQNLPGMTGLDLLDEVRRRGANPAAVLITSHPSPAILRRAAAAGVPIVEKPFLGNALIETIRSVMERKH